MSHTIITRLSQRERFLIETALKKRKKIAVIAQELGRHRSTLYREISRNGFNHYNYNSLEAEDKSVERRFKKNQTLKSNNQKLLKNDKLFAKVFLLLRDYSPMVISKRLLKGKISHQSIYNTIYALSQRKIGLYKFLYSKHNKRKKQGCNSVKSLKIPNRISIHQRPKIVSQLKRKGDFELDLICLSKKYIVSLIERKTKLCFFELIDNKSSNTVAQCVIKLLTPIKDKVKTITTDNGTEFYQHQSITQELGAKVYFCDPYSSWQKGMVENVNKMVRKYLPKGYSYSHITNDKIKAIQSKINLYPRKCLNFKSASETFYKKSVALTR